MDASPMVNHCLYHQQMPQKSVLDPACGRSVEFIGLGGWWCNFCEASVLEPKIVLPADSGCPYSHLHVG